MQNIAIFHFLIFICVFYSCKQKDNNGSSTMVTIDGIWAENEDANALFQIKNDSIFYFENFDNPVPYSLHEEIFVIGNNPPVKCEIVKLTEDSLVFIDEFTEDTTRLYRRSGETPH